MANKWSHMNQNWKFATKVKHKVCIILLGPIWFPLVGLNSIGFWSSVSLAHDGIESLNSIHFHCAEFMGCVRFGQKVMETVRILNPSPPQCRHHPTPAQCCRT
jgi:hypothetical protein